MDRRKHDANMDEMEGVAKRLRDERPEASPLELDRIKMTAMSRAKSGTRGRAGSRRLAVAGLTAGLLMASTGGVLAWSHSGGKSGSNAANTQYGGQCNVSVGSGNSGSHNGNGNEVNTCNENIFISETTTITTTSTTSGAPIVNNYYTTVSATPPASGVLSSKTSKPKTSGKNLRFRVKAPHGLKLRKVTVKINGKNVKTLYAKKASKNIELVNLPCTSTGETTVTITVKLSDGKTVTSTHTYKLCAS